MPGWSERKDGGGFTGGDGAAQFFASAFMAEAHRGAMSAISRGLSVSDTPGSHPPMNVPIQG